MKTKPSARVIATQELRRSSASSPHATNRARPRGTTNRAAIAANRRGE